MPSNYHFLNQKCDGRVTHSQRSHDRVTTSLYSNEFVLCVSSMRIRTSFRLNSPGVHGGS